MLPRIGSSKKKDAEDAASTSWLPLLGHVVLFSGSQRHTVVCIPPIRESSPRVVDAVVDYDRVLPEIVDAPPTRCFRRRCSTTHTPGTST